MCGTPVSAPAVPREARKNVAILFMDLVGSTALAESLDPEPLRQIMDRYFAAASASIAAHGGAVEKFIGDAVMSVFGATVSHEDDALRAVRAAMEAVAKVNELSAGLVATHKVTLEVRCGICSGEVIAITTPGDFRVIGDPVNTAARLQTAAEPGEILVDTVSASMVRAHVGLDPIPPLHLKGKAQPVPAWRVTGRDLSADTAVDQPLTPLIGREDELDELEAAFRRVTKRNQLYLVTVLGAPGIGKSRLVRDFVRSLGPADVTVLTGKCSAYGRGITYQPLAEMLTASGWAEQAKRLESGGSEAQRAAKSLAQIMTDGTSVISEAVGIEEISWAVRYLLGQLGSRKPVIMVWEDLHWAESTLLDMIDDVVNWLTDVPVLLLCVARMDLLDSRPSWGGGKSSAMALEVGPLSPAQSAKLVAEITTREEVYAHQAEALCERVTQECEGNPLFAELMLDVFAESAPGTRLPPTISALLTARLDQLPHDERELLEVASAIGRDFSPHVLRAMLAADTGADADLQDIIDRLVRRRIITRVDGGYRFGQTLMRDTAYTLSPKSKRERWHLLLADQMAELISNGSTATLPDAQLALAYHVEAASLLQRELRPGDEDQPRLAPQAAKILLTEGTKALHRRDLPSAAALLERGRHLLSPADEQQIPLMLYISDCWFGMSDPDRAIAALTSGPVAPTGDGRADLIGRIQRCIIELRQGIASSAEITARADQLVSEARQQTPPDHRARGRLHQLNAYVHLANGRTAQAERELRHALEAAKLVCDDYETDWLLGALCELAQWAPTPVSVSLALCDELVERFATSRVLLVPVLFTKARLAAIGGDLDAARAALGAAREYISDLHLDVGEVVLAALTGLVDSLAGDHREAEAGYRRSHALLVQMGRVKDALVYGAYAARELFEQGDIGAADQAADRLITEAPALDLRTDVVRTALLARINAANGELDRAIELAVKATELSEKTDDLYLQGDCYADLAIVAAQASQSVAAADAATTGLDRYRAKGASMHTVRAQQLIAMVGEE